MIRRFCRSDIARLVGSLRQYGASLETEVVPVGHELWRGDITLAQRWIRRVYEDTP